MYRSKKRLFINILVPLLVLSAGLGTLCATVRTVRRSARESLEVKVELNAVSYSNRMISDLERSVAITDTLEQIVISEHGRVDGFSTIAENMFADFVQSIQLAPGGVVEWIYPSAGNEAGKIDLINDSQRGPLSRYAMENNKTIIQGPFDLKQGGRGMAVRNPVFLENDDGESEFWGFTVVVVKVPEIFDTSVNMLGQFGYEYRLSRTQFPTSSEFFAVCASSDALCDPVVREFSVGGCRWRLEVSPRGGWDKSTSPMAVSAFGGVIVFFAVVLTHVMLVFYGNKKKYKELATLDALTGLLNRHGFAEEAERYMAAHSGEPCVGILLDVDDFKFVNDLYGHSVGDATLCHLARGLREAFAADAILGRNGGDEFCVILKNCTAEDAQERIRRFTEERRVFVCDSVEHTFTISVGYAGSGAGTESISTLLSKADMALYEAKLSGKNNCCIYNVDYHMEKRTQLGFALTDVSQHLPGAFLIYKADADDDTLLFANREMIKFAGCRDLDDFMSFTRGRFRNLIRPDEREAVERSIWEQINSGSDGSNDYVRFHFAMKDGSYRDVLDHGRIVDSSYYGRVFYVLMMDSAFIKSHYEQDR